MDLKSLLENYINKVANSAVPQVQQQASSIQDRILQLQEDENVVDADIQKEQPALGQDNQNLEVEDVLLQNAMPEMQLPDEDDSSFGKVSYFKALQKRAASNKPKTLLSALKAKYGANHHRRQTTSKK